MNAHATTVESLGRGSVLSPLGPANGTDPLPFPAGVPWGKLMMWLFLCSDAMSFGALIAAYAAYRYMDPAWPNPQDILGINLTALMTFVLIVSSVTMVKALASIQKGDQKGIVKFMALTILGGLFFLGCQAYEWHHLITSPVHDPAKYPFFSEGMIFHKHAFAGTFYILTGFHGLHVTGGVIYNSIILLLAKKGKYSAERYDQVEIAGLYWHFVDLVWILIFTFVYLI